jgi:hypothetical protein
MAGELLSRQMLSRTKLEPYAADEIHAVRQRLDQVSAVAQVEQAEALIRIAEALEELVAGR